MSTGSGLDANTSFARTFVDELVRGGVEVAVVAPGSRSTPLALALAADERVSVHVLLDERSAAGFALGAARASERPTVLCCTSGTAAAHFHWAVLEAHHGRVGRLVTGSTGLAQLPVGRDVEPSASVIAVESGSNAYETPPPLSMSVVGVRSVVMTPARRECAALASFVAPTMSAITAVVRPS